MILNPAHGRLGRLGVAGQVGSQPLPVAVAARQTSAAVCANSQFPVLMVQVMCSLSNMEDSHSTAVSTGPPPALGTSTSNGTAATEPGPLPPTSTQAGVEERHGRWLADAPWWEDAACSCEERCGVAPEGRQGDAAEPEI